MSYSILKRIVYVLGAAALLGAVTTRFMEYESIRALLGDAARPVAWWVGVCPLAVSMAFMLLQAVPGGRVVVPTPFTRNQDVWQLILILASVTPSFELARLVSPHSFVGTRDFVHVSMVTTFACFVMRIIQFHLGARVGVVVAPDQRTIH